MSDKSLIEAIQSECLVSDETALAIIQQRKTLKKPLTARAAKSLAREFAKCADPEAAIDYWMNRGWQGFFYSWYAREEQRQHSTGNALLDAVIGRVN